MKRNLFLILIAFAAMSIIGCGTEDSKTELQITNSHESIVTVNTFLWKDDSGINIKQSWESTAGWVPYVDASSNSTTEAKEVPNTLGEFGAIYNDPDFGVLDSDISIEGKASDQIAVQLAEGGLNKYTIIAKENPSALSMRNTPQK